MSDYKIETECVQGGYKPKSGEPRVLPIVQRNPADEKVSVYMFKALSVMHFLHVVLCDHVRRYVVNVRSVS